MLAAVEFVSESDFRCRFEAKACVIGRVAEDNGPAAVGRFAGQQASTNEVGSDSLVAVRFTTASGPRPRPIERSSVITGLKATCPMTSLSTTATSEMDNLPAARKASTSWASASVGKHSQFTAKIAGMSADSSLRTMHVMAIAAALLRDGGFGFFDDGVECGGVENR